MGLLPQNKETDIDISPRIFLIWGDSMSGKTYLATKFPNAVLLNTDGNGEKVSTPSVAITSWRMMVEAIRELESTNHGFETVIIDLVEDIKMMMDLDIVEKYNSNRKAEDAVATSIADIGFGKGYFESQSLWKQFIMRLSKMNMNVIFISHSKTGKDDILEPALEKKYVNVLKGRCDLVIRTFKAGKEFVQKVTDKRSNYVKEDFKNESILKALDEVDGLFKIETPNVKKPQIAVAPTPKVETAKTVIGGIEKVEDIKVDEPIVIEEDTKPKTKKKPQFGNIDLSK